MRVRDREFVPSTPRGMQKMQQKIPQLDAVGGFAILVVILHNASLKYPALYLEGMSHAAGWELIFSLPYQGFGLPGFLSTPSSQAAFSRISTSGVV